MIEELEWRKVRGDWQKREERMRMEEGWRKRNALEG